MFSWQVLTQVRPEILKHDFIIWIGNSEFFAAEIQKQWGIFNKFAVVG